MRLKDADWWWVILAVAGLGGWLWLGRSDGGPLKAEVDASRATNDSGQDRRPCGWVNRFARGRRQGRAAACFASMTRRCAPACAAPRPRLLPSRQPLSRTLSDRWWSTADSANPPEPWPRAEPDNLGRVVQARPTWPARSQLAQPRPSNGWPRYAWGARTRWCGRVPPSRQSRWDPRRTVPRNRRSRGDRQQRQVGGGRGRPGAGRLHRPHPSSGAPTAGLGLPSAARPLPGCWPRE